MFLLSDEDKAVQPRVLAHYELVGPLIEASLGQTPIVFANYPDGFEQPALFHVTTVPLAVRKLLWLVHREYAMEFYTWAPSVLDMERLRFGRILLEAPPGVAFERVKLAALAMRALLLDAAKLQAVPLLDGGTGIALWVPLADEPLADILRKWLHGLCSRAVELHADLLSTSYNTHHDGRVHLHVSSNAAGHYSAVPYSLRAQGLTVCTPIHWEELDSLVGADEFHIGDIKARLGRCGDVFADAVKAAEGQTLPEM